MWFINKKILLTVLRARKSTADVLEDSLSGQGYFTNSLLLIVTSHRRKDKGAHRGLFNKDTSPMY